jgi:hypothetical protein
MLSNAIFLVVQKVKSAPLWRQDLNRVTYLEHHLAPSGDLLSYFDAVSGAALLGFADQIKALTEHYIAHRFDLLGSGWVLVKHGMTCHGLEGHLYRMGASVEPDSEGNWLEERINGSNLPESQRIWRLVGQGYVPIDWHLDFKSGYRWSERTWYLNIRYGYNPGVDIKVPWELARMQHLVQLAWAYGLGQENHPDFLKPQTYSSEFRNQILDFVATNPPRFGVNWHMCMDVAIRVANWLVAYDLFRAYGVEFDEQFRSIFYRSIYEHGLHIITHLEWCPELRGNHYFANIVGLFFVAAYLPRTVETDAWLAFSLQELIKEMESQFNPDGSNFEASTSYHRLVAEMVIYATALVLGLSKDKKSALKNYDHSMIKVKPGLNPPPILHHMLSTVENPKSEIRNSKYETPFPAWYFDRLRKMAEFTMHITKPDGRIPQIGDNDNGRFLKLHPVYRTMTVAEAKALYVNLAGYDELPDEAVYWVEEYLEHRHLVAAINGLLGRDDFAAFTGQDCLETEIVKHLAQTVRFFPCSHKAARTASECMQIGTVKDWQSLKARLNSYPEQQREVVEIISSSRDLREGLTLHAYPDFGLYLYISPYFYLAIRCGSIGQNGFGGHAHNDQLSIELNVDGEDKIADPGTYLYTPLRDRRNEYRSVRAHFAPQITDDTEPGRLDLGLFRLGDKVRARCKYFGSEGFIGVHRGYGKPLYRLVAIEKNKVVIMDVSEAGQLLRGRYERFGVSRKKPNEPPPESGGYGWRSFRRISDRI